VTSWEWITGNSWVPAWWVTVTECWEMKSNVKDTWWQGSLVLTEGNSTRHCDSQMFRKQSFTVSANDCPFPLIPDEVIMSWALLITLIKVFSWKMYKSSPKKLIFVNIYWAHACCSKTYKYKITFLNAISWKWTETADVKGNKKIKK